MNGEDYALAIPPSEGGLIDRLQAIWLKAVHHAWTWNGRLGELLSIFFLSIPRGVLLFAQVATALGFLALCLRMAGHQVIGAAAAAFALGLFCLIWPRMELVYWSTVSIGYLLPISLTLLLMLVVSDARFAALVLLRRDGLVAVAGLALMVGFSFENLPPAIALFVALVAALQPAHLRRRLLLIAALVLVGWVALMLLPSTSFRQIFYRERLNAPDLGIGYVIDRAKEVTAQFLESSSVLLVVSSVAAFVVLKREGLSPDGKKLALLFVPAVLAVGAVVASPYTEPRSFALAWAIMLVFVFRAFAELPKSWQTGLAVVVGFAGLAAALQTFTEYRAFAGSVAARDAIIEQAKKSGQCDDGLALDLITTDAPIRELNNRDRWVMFSQPTFGRYWGCKIISVGGTPNSD